ncbi:MAG: Ppx/GppA family phosphatase [Rhizobacter sp.]|nr:Ppx/GppA family phosphatase [Rhizobacter sp.]
MDWNQTRPADTHSRWPGQLAGIDMGSNSFRLEVGQVIRGRYRRVEYLKETVQLGAGLDDSGMLGEPAMQRGLACLARFAQRLAGYTPQQVRAVTTQTLREARNRDAFLARAQQILGLPIEVISGREEARLIYAGVARLQPSPDRRLVVDIGGRSTEVILGEGRKALQVESFGVGCIALSTRYFGDGRFTEGAFQAAQVAAGAEFEEALETFAAMHWQEALGASGTVAAVSQLLAVGGQSDGSVTPQALRWLTDQCLRAGHVDRLELPGLKDERRGVIAGGIAILAALCAKFGIASLQPAQGALRQGVIFDLDERLQATALQQVGHDVRDASVRELQRRFMVDMQQAKRVSAVAERLYADLQPEAGAEARRELLWAAALHEMGMMVSHHDHHRHSAYLLASVDAAGFSQNQLQHLSTLVLGQRGGLRKIRSALADPDVALQLLSLRLAIIRCHARGDVDLEALQVDHSGAKVRLLFAGAWAQANPGKLHLLREEIEAWTRVGVLGLELVER